MTNYIFSPSKNAFYPYLLKENYLSAGSWPDDGIDVDEAIFNEFTREPPEGKIRAAGSDGLPIWIDAPALTQEQLVAAAELRKSTLQEKAQSTISSWQSKLLLGIINDAEKASLISWLAYIDKLNAVDTANPDWPVPPSV